MAASVVETGFGFALAPRFHASMRHAGAIRLHRGASYRKADGTWSCHRCGYFYDKKKA